MSSRGDERAGAASTPEQRAPIAVLYKDAAVAVIDKPAGLPVEADSDESYGPDPRDRRRFTTRLDTPRRARLRHRVRDAHELIKVRAGSMERGARESALTEICSRLDAQAVQHIGKVLVLYRAKPQ